MLIVERYVKELIDATFNKLWNRWDGKLVNFNKNSILSRKT